MAAIFTIEAQSAWMHTDPSLGPSYKPPENHQQ